MSIKRITNPSDFNKAIDDLESLFSNENIDQGHQFLIHDKECIKRSFGHVGILNWDLFVWAHSSNGKFDAIIAFVNEKNPKFNTAIFSEFLWLSKNPKIGYALFKTATQFAREKGFELISMNTVCKNPSHNKIKRFYKNIGLLKDSETYIGKL